MVGEIEKMALMRKNILKGLFIGYGVWFGLFQLLYIFILPYLFRSIQPFIDKIKPYYFGVGILGLLVFFLFLVKFWLYKRTLKKDPSLKTAVNDERDKLNWLRSYRIAFLIVMGIEVAGIVIESFLFSKYFPSSEIVSLYLGVMFLIGSFLHFDKEVEDGRSHT